MQAHVVCKRDQLTPGEMQSFQVGRQRIAVVQTADGTYYAVGDACPHQGAPLSNGQVEQMWVSEAVGEAHAAEDRVVVVCPWHNFEYDLETGCSPCYSDKLRIQTYKVEVDGEDVVVYV